jgi:hypothetical protein
MTTNKIIDFDKKIKIKTLARNSCYSLAMFFAGATIFSNNLFYGLLFGFTTMVWIITGNQLDTDVMVWELKKEMNK